MAKITTVIDIGSNSVRMAIFKRTSRFGFFLIYELKSKVRISEGTYEKNGFLQEIPMQRAISALKEFKKIAQLYKSKKILCIATSALRDAPNARDFIQRTARECALNIKIIDGKKEAFFGGVACANLSHQKDGIMVDIGGGSTECTLIENGKIKDVISLNLGTIRLKELFFDKKLDLKEAREFIQQQIALLPKHFSHHHIFGVGGTIRALAKTIMKQNKYPLDLLHGFEIDIAKHHHLFLKIIKSKEDKLLDLGIVDDRLDNIRGGLLILLMLIEHFQSAVITVCGVGIREGAFLADLLRHHHFVIPNQINPSIQFIKDTFLHLQQTPQIKKTALKIFDLLQVDFGLGDRERRLLGISCLLLQNGSMIDFYHNSKHSAYLAKYALHYGFSHADRAMITLLIQFSEKKLPKDIDLQGLEYLGLDLQNLQIMSYILSLAKVLELSCSSKAQITFKENVLNLVGLGDHFIVLEKINKLVRPKNLTVVLQ